MPVNLLSVIPSARAEESGTFTLSLSEYDRSNNLAIREVFGQCFDCVEKLSNQQDKIFFRSPLSRTAQSVMSISKRPLPPEMIIAEKQVESWWKDQTDRLPADAASATLLLCQTAARRLAEVFRQLDPNDPNVFHNTARQYVFALQTVVRAVKGALPAGEFPTTYAPSSLGASQDLADDVLVKAVDYGYVRDTYLAFKWGGYDLKCPSANVLEFQDVPAWKGARDNAVRQISERLEYEKACAAAPVLSASGWPLFKYEYEGPQTLSFRQLNLAEFLRGWSALSQEFSNDVLSGTLTVTSLDQLVAMLSQRAALNPTTAEAFIRLISFDKASSAALTIFHCPLVPVTGSSYAVMVLPMMLSRITTCVNRLAIHRGVGYSAFSKQVEAYYLDLMKQHYETKDVIVVPNVPYTFEGIQRDIDLVVYESAHKRLLVGMLKAFVEPDTVEEVVRANEQLAYAINQAEDARSWLKTVPPEQVSQRLRLPTGIVVEKIEYAVFGNGFAGSDYLPLDSGIPVTDTRFALSEKFRRGSIFDAIAQYTADITEGANVSTT